MPSGWPSAIAPPFGLTCSASSGNAKLAQHRERLRGERLVEFDHIDVAKGMRVSSSSFCDAGAGPMPMMRGGTPAVAVPTTRARG